MTLHRPLLTASTDVLIRLILGAVFLRKSLPAAEQRFPLKCVLVEALPHFRQPLRSLGSLFSIGAATAAVAENLAAAVVNNVSLYVETM